MQSQPCNPPYIYVIVRTDIPIADQMVQVGHACQLSGHFFGCPDNCHLVLCQTPDEDSLDSHHDYCHANGIRHVMFEEDKDDMGWTALCTEPITDKRPLLAHLRLWRPPQTRFQKCTRRVKRWLRKQLQIADALVP